MCRRLFITAAIRAGRPPHIAQVIAGRANVTTTMGYHAICPAGRWRPIAPPSPVADRCDLPRSTAPPPTPRGRTSWATSNAAGSPSEPALAPTALTASTSTPASATSHISAERADPSLVTCAATSPQRAHRRADVYGQDEQETTPGERRLRQGRLPPQQQGPPAEEHPQREPGPDGLGER
jgi:hypothetical protein